jgi:Cell Wall Hydrolase
VKTLLSGWFTAVLLVLLTLVYAIHSPIIAYNITVLRPWDSVRTEMDLTSTDDTDTVDFRQLKCVATAIYYESQSEPRLAQIAVARVIQNRVLAGFAATPCDVVFQKSSAGCQFSWVCGPHQLIPVSKCVQCWQAAAQVLVQHQYQNYLSRALYFRSIDMAPPRRAALVRQVGRQVFY